MQITKNFWDLANFLLVFVHRFYLKKKKKEYRQIRQQSGGGKEKILIYGRDLKIISHGKPFNNSKGRGW